MGNDRRITKQTEEILDYLSSEPTTELAGADIERATGIKKGTVYPAVARMTRFGWLEWRWEDIDPKVAGRPRKRLYKLTGEGERAVQQIASEALARERTRERKRMRVQPSPRGVPS
jgi:DNA-binding PadR family transcriptional regulator